MSDLINVNEVTIEQWAAAESCALERIAELEARWAALREWAVRPLQHLYRHDPIKRADLLQEMDRLERDPKKG